MEVTDKKSFNSNNNKLAQGLKHALLKCLKHTRIDKNHISGSYLYHSNQWICLSYLKIYLAGLLVLIIKPFLVRVDIDDQAV